MTLRALAQRYGDALLAASLAALMLVEASGFEGADPHRIVPASLLATLPLVLRRRAPVVGFLLVAIGFAAVLTSTARALSEDSLAEEIVALVALYSLGRYARQIEAWVGVALVLAATVGLLLADADGTPWQPDDIGFTLVMVAGPWAVGVIIRLRRDQAVELRARADALARDQQAAAAAAVAAERDRIARELHDVVSHAIAVTVLQARGARRMIGVDDDQVREACDAIDSVNTQALADMRRLLTLLRDADTESSTTPAPSLERLDSLAKQVRDAGLPVEYVVQGRPEDVPPGVSLSAYRIIQEALTNVLKHGGPAVTAHVDVSCGSQSVRVAVSDDGNGPSHPSERGSGLLGMRERVAVTGGQFEAGPLADGGFLVAATLPYATAG